MLVHLYTFQDICTQGLQELLDCILDCVPGHCAAVLGLGHVLHSSLLEPRIVVQILRVKKIPLDTCPLIWYDSCMHALLSILPDAVDIGEVALALLVVLTSVPVLFALKFVAARTKNKYDDAIVAKFVDLVEDKDLQKLAKERLRERRQKGQ